MKKLFVLLTIVIALASSCTEKNNEVVSNDSTSVDSTSITVDSILDSIKTVVDSTVSDTIVK